MASKNIASISHIDWEELRRKEIKSPSKLFSSKYLSPASIVELNKNPSASKRVHFINSIVILSKENEAEEGETMTDIMPEHGQNITKEVKEEVKKVIDKEESDVEEAWKITGPRSRKNPLPPIASPWSSRLGNKLCGFEKIPSLVPYGRKFAMEGMHYYQRLSLGEYMQEEVIGEDLAFNRLECESRSRGDDKGRSHETCDFESSKGCIASTVLFQVWKIGPRINWQITGKQKKSRRRLERIRVVKTVMEACIHAKLSTVPRLRTSTKVPCARLNKRKRNKVDGVEIEILVVLKVIANRIVEPEQPPKPEPPTLEDYQNKLKTIGWAEDDPLYEVALAIFCEPILIAIGKGWIAIKSGKTKQGVLDGSK
ncbi:hypothetical protein Tco_0551896 [Tanacetum coccineum]